MLTPFAVRALAALALAGAGGAVADDLRSGFVLVANQQSADASLINLRTDESRRIAVGAGPHEAVISPSGRVGIVTVYGVQGAPGNQLAVIDLRAGTVTRTISLGEYTRPHGAIFLPGERRAVVTSETTQRLIIVDLVAGTVEAAIPTEATGSHMVGVTADGKRAFTANIGSGGISEIDLEGRKLVRTIPVAQRTEGIAVTPDGSTVWVGSNTDGTVSVIDTRTGAITDTLKGLGMPYRLAASADGRTMIIVDPQGDQIHVADVATRKVTWSLGSLASPRGVNIAPDGRTAFVTQAGDQTVAIVDLVTRKVTRTVGVGTAPDGVWYGPDPGR